MKNSPPKPGPLDPVSLPASNSSVTSHPQPSVTRPSDLSVTQSSDLPVTQPGDSSVSQACQCDDCKDFDETDDPYSDILNMVTEFCNYCQESGPEEECEVSADSSADSVAETESVTESAESESADYLHSCSEDGPGQIKACTRCHIP